jgi:hypothetical protein
LYPEFNGLDWEIALKQLLFDHPSLFKHPQFDFDDGWRPTVDQEGEDFFPHTFELVDLDGDVIPEAMIEYAVPDTEMMTAAHIYKFNGQRYEMKNIVTDFNGTPSEPSAWVSFIGLYKDPEDRIVLISQSGVYDMFGAFSFLRYTNGVYRLDCFINDAGETVRDGEPVYNMFDWDPDEYGNREADVYYAYDLFESYVPIEPSDGTVYENELRRVMMAR